MAENKVVHKFYKKPMATKYTMMANFAVSDHIKRSTLTNGVERRLGTCQYVVVYGITIL